MTLNAITNTTYEISSPRGWSLEDHGNKVTLTRDPTQMTEPMLLSGGPFKYTFGSVTQFDEFVSTLVQLREELSKLKAGNKLPETGDKTKVEG